MSVAIQVTTPLDDTPFNNKRAMHRNEKETPAGLQEDDSSAVRLIATIVGVGGSVLSVRDCKVCASGNDLGNARTGTTLYRGVRREHNIMGNWGGDRVRPA